MYTIGQFSKIGMVSAKTLRYYDEINLLKPSYVDSENQYRYYSDKQVPEILFISEMKNYGLKLEEIKVVMDNPDPFLLETILKNKADEINAEIQKNIILLKLIENKIIKIKSGGNIMEMNSNLKVELEDKKSMYVAYRRAVISMSNIGNIIGKVFEDMSRMNLKAEGPIMTVYHDKEFDHENADIEICIPVNKKAGTDKTENIRKFSGGLHACTTFIGPYSKLGEAYAKVMKWIEENGYENSGAPFDIYLTGAESCKNPNEFVTEVCFPVNKK